MADLKKAMIQAEEKYLDWIGSSEADMQTSIELTRCNIRRLIEKADKNTLNFIAKLLEN